MLCWLKTHVFSCPYPRPLLVGTGLSTLGSVPDHSVFWALLLSVSQLTLLTPVCFHSEDFLPEIS
jgi:hypothetical protein